MSRTARIVLLACAVALAGACGEQIAARAARDLDANYEQLVAAVDAGDRAEARRALRALTAAVDSWESSGAIDPARADAITAAAAQVLADLTLLPKEESPPPSPTLPPSPSPTPSEGEDHGEGEKDEKPEKPPGHEKNEDKGEKVGHED